MLSMEFSPCKLEMKIKYEREVLPMREMNCIDRGAFASIVWSFWLLGLLNNAPWVLMLACATNISSGGVALVVSRY